MTRKPPDIALLGAGDPLGEAVLRQLEERETVIGTLYPLATNDEQASVMFRGTERPLLDASGFDWTHADILISASHAALAGHVEALAAGAGVAVLGFGPAGAGGRYLSIPGAEATALHRVLSPIARRSGLASLDVTAAVPVCLAGQEGIDELATQTRGLFAMESPEPGVFPPQIAFNLVPQVGPLLDDGSTSHETGIVRQTRALLGAPQLPMTATAMWSPLFHGGALVIHGTTSRPLDSDELRKTWKRMEGVVFMDARVPGGAPTPATDAQDGTDVFVGRLRHDADAPTRFSLWLVMDVASLEAAQIVDALEKMIEK